jgi:hypothetical protein
MAGTKKTTKVTKPEYPVKRGSRYDALCLNLVHNQIVQGLENTKPEKDNEVVDYNVAMQASNEGIQQFCRLVIYAKRSANGALYTLPMTDGERFVLPTIHSSAHELAAAYINFLMMDEDTIEEIDRSILEVNKPLAARFQLPREYLTEKEKSDPNS